MRTAERADRIAPRRSDRSCESRGGEVQGFGQGGSKELGKGQGASGSSGGARLAGEIWSEQDRRGLTARELIRLAQAVRLRPGRD